MVARQHLLRNIPSVFSRLDERRQRDRRSTRNSHAVGLSEGPRGASRSTQLDLPGVALSGILLGHQQHDGREQGAGHAGGFFRTRARDSYAKYEHRSRLASVSVREDFERRSGARRRKNEQDQTSASEQTRRYERRDDPRIASVRIDHVG